MNKNLTNLQMLAGLYLVLTIIGLTLNQIQGNSIVSFTICLAMALILILEFLKK